MAMKTIICLSFIVLNNFFASMCVKKNCASPTKSLTARHWKAMYFRCGYQQLETRLTQLCSSLVQ